MKIKYLVLATTILCIGCSSSSESASANDKNKEMYSNPVLSKSLPDPTIIKDKDGNFYLYATEDTRNVPILKSNNLVDWTYLGTAFTNETRPNFEPDGGIWAPDINYINGKYVLYYSMSVWGGEWTCGIGVASSDKPEGPFVDHGKMFRSNEIDVQNSIDPFYIEDNGVKYMLWGSFRGIYGIELSDDGVSVKLGANKFLVAGTAYEGTYIHKRDGYYYFFGSIGTCCEGERSTYTTVVGRSKNFKGPYVNKQGESMLDNHHELLISKNNRFVGNGHNAEIVTDDKCDDWMLFHGVDLQRPNGRVLMLEKILWDKNGWPYIENGTPSLKAEKPFFNKK